jgi:IS4 transposase
MAGRRKRIQARDLRGVKYLETNHAVRVVCVKTAPHKKRSGRKGKTAGPACDGGMRIATNLLDTPTELIAQINKQRWMIEIFFRFSTLPIFRLLDQEKPSITTSGSPSLLMPSVIARTESSFYRHE